MAGNKVVVYQPPRPRGRPSLYTVELGEYICDRMAEGATLVEICREEGMPKPMTVSGWTDQHPNFNLAYARARALQLEAWGAEARQYANSPQTGLEVEMTETTDMEGRTYVSKKVRRQEMLGHRRLQVDTLVRLIGAVQHNEMVRLAKYKAEGSGDDTGESKIVIEGGLPEDV